MSNYQFLLTSVEDGVGILQLNHPEKRNALDLAMRAAIAGSSKPDVTWALPET